MDKYYYLARCMESTQYVFLKRNDWDLSLVRNVIDIPSSEIFAKKDSPVGIKIHLIKSFSTELRKALMTSDCDTNNLALLSTGAFAILLQQFRIACVTSSDILLCKLVCDVMMNIHTYKIRVSEGNSLDIVKSFLCQLETSVINTSYKKSRIVKHAINALNNIDKPSK